MDESLVDIDRGNGKEARELPDARDREVIERDLDVNVVVVASAGTGKTEALIRRMVASVVSGAVDMDSLVAITFTRMAAGEMRARFAEKLREAAPTSERARQALRRIDRCFVGTIHAFCARILRERPLEAGLRPDFTEVDEHDVTVLWRHFWRDALQQLYAEGDDRIDTLRRLGINVGDLYEFFVTRSENSDLPLKQGLAVEPDLDEPLNEVISHVDEIKKRLGGSITAERDGFLDQVDRADHLRLNSGVADAADKALLLKIYRRGFKSITYKYWPDEDLAAHVKKDIAPELLEDVIDPALTRWRQHVYGLVAPLMEEIVERFARYRRNNGLVTFHDLLVCTARVLRTRPEVRRFFQRKFAAFFVDEFQDTDPLQAEIVMYLVAGASTESDWRRLVPEPGKLFVVGDEKQSIYRFRRADIDVFRLVRDRILESGGTLVRLKTSFRSQARLCDWLNGTFKALFDQHDRRVQAEYDELLPYHPSEAGAVCVQKITIDKVTGNDQEVVAQKEADRIAVYIRQETSGPDARRAPGDFMILTRRRKFLNVYSAALEERGIPYDIIGGDSLSRSEELWSIIQMMEVIRRPADEVAMLGYLRGPLVGLGDDELYEFRKAGGRFRRSRMVPDGLHEELKDRLVEARDQLDRVRNDLMLLSPSAAIDNIFNWTGLMAFSAGLDGGATRAGNLVRVVSLVRSWEEKGMNWSEIVSELREVIEDSKYQYEQMTLDVGRADVVRVMNLHQAKGLQAPVVILADSYERSRPEPSQHVSRAEGREYLSIPITASRNSHYSETVAEPVGWQADLENERKYSEAEEIRNVYVAATRAKDRLIVCKYAGNKDRGPWCRLYPMLASAPELAAAGAAVPAPGAAVPAPVPEPLEDVLEITERVRTRWEQAAEPSARVMTATGDDPAHGVEDFPVGGRGADYGSVMHEVIQALVEQRISDARSYAASRAKAAGIERHLDQLLSEVALLQKSELWRELGSASQVYSEVPFAYRLSGEDAVIRGTIDLIYRTGTGWKIVDFKTHRAGSGEEIDALRDRYAPQLQTYVNAWKDVTKEDVSEAGLWLTDRGVYVPLAN